MTPIPLLDRVTSLVAWLADRIGGLRDPAGRDQAGAHPAGHDQAGRDPAGAHPAGLEPAHAGALLARLHQLVARFRAIIGSPIPPPKPAPKPVEPRFVPTHSSRFVTAEDIPPERTGLPRSWRWLPRLLPQVAAGRAQMEDLLRDPATADRLAADPRLGPILRPLGWMLGVDRKLLPPARRRTRPVFLVPGGRSDAAAAAETYARARSKDVSITDIIALWCRPAAGGRDKRPVWRGSLGRTLGDGTKIPG